MTEAIDMKVELKLKGKRVIFSFIDNWTNVIHHVEKLLPVRLIVEPYGRRLTALEDDAVNVFEKIISDEHIIKKLKLSLGVKNRITCKLIALSFRFTPRTMVV